jgi:phage-related protein
MAGGPSRTLKLFYTSDTSGLKKGNEQAESALSKLGSKFQSFAKFAAVGAAAAGAALIAFGKKAVDAAAEAEAAQTRLATILRNTGLATEDQIKGLNAQAAALEKVGVASAGNITVLQGQLATFDLTADTIRTLTPAIVDYVIAEKGAAASAGDFQSAANGLAQALQGNFASLTRTGFVLDDTTKALITNGTEAERAAALAEVLGSTYANFNEIARDTAEGQLVALKNSFASLTETVGTLLLPIFRRLIDVAFVVVQRLEELWEIHGPEIIAWINRATERFGNLWNDLRTRFAPIISTVIVVIRQLVQDFKAFVSIALEWWNRVSPGVFASFARLSEPVRNLFTAVRSVFTSLGEVVSAFRTVETSGNLFQGFIDRVVNAIGILIRVLNIVLGLLDRFLGLIVRVVESRAFQALLSGFERVANGITNLTGQAAGLSPTVVPTVTVAPRVAPTTNITVNTGIGDPAAIARAIREIEQSEDERSGRLIQTIR